MYLEWFFKEKAAGEKSLEEVVVDLLAERKLHVTTAESCTGGLIAGTLVNVAGASDVLNEGYVTYSNEAKERLIHVSHETLEAYGAVSEQTAHEMAEGAARAANADAALSATGIAGPGGGTEEKPREERMPVRGQKGLESPHGRTCQAAVSTAVSDSQPGA